MPSPDDQQIEVASDIAASRRRSPWILYWLIDSTTEPTNHDQGTIFYIAARPGIKSQGTRERVPLNPRDLAAPESLPKGEDAARARLEQLVAHGTRRLVEVIADHRAWTQGIQAGENDLARMVGLLCNALRPPPLKATTQAAREIVRYPADLVTHGLEARPARLPDGVVVYRSIQSCAPFKSIADPAAAPPTVVAKLFGEFSLTQKPKRLQREAAGEGVIWLLVAGARLAERILPPGFVLDVWAVERLDHHDGQVRLQTVETARSGALRRHLLGTVIDVWSDQEGLSQVQQV